MSLSLVQRLERDGVDTARRGIVSREETGVMDAVLRGWMGGLSQALFYVTGETPGEIEERWMKAASQHFTVPQQVRDQMGTGS